MQADTIDSTTAGGDEPGKSHETSAPSGGKQKGFTPADWLRRWVANGNEAQLMPDGRLWLVEGTGGDWRERDSLSFALGRRAGIPALKAYMAGTGQYRIGVAA